MLDQNYREAFKMVLFPEEVKYNHNALRKGEFVRETLR